MRNLPNYFVLFIAISLLCFTACEQEIIETPSLNLESTVPSEELANLTATLNEEDKPLFSEFSKIKYNGMEYTAEEAEHSDELRQLMENKASFVITRDLDVYRTYLRANSEDTAEEPQHDVLHILDNEVDQEVFIRNRERQVGEMGDEYRDGCWNKFKLHLTLYAEKNYVGAKLTYFNISKEWDKNEFIDVPNSFQSTHGVASYKAKFIHLPKKDKPLYQPRIMLVNIIDNTDGVAFIENKIFGHKCETHTRGRSGFGTSLLTNKVEIIVIGVSNGNTGKYNSVVNFDNVVVGLPT